MRATDLTPLTVPEVRRLLLAGEAPPPHQQHLLAWSHFRRAHQAHAGRAHAARRARTHTPAGTLPSAAAAAAAAAARPEASGPPALQLAGTATLTEATWAQIAPLLPRLQLAPKRTRYEHRRVLDGILAVMRSGRSWREGPARDTPWPILYQRYSLWRRRGIWDAILCILHPEADVSFAT